MSMSTKESKQEVKKTAKKSQTSETTAKKVSKKETKVVKEKKTTKEPVPEDTEASDVAESKKKYETYQDALKARKEIDVAIKELYKERAMIEKEMDSFFTKTEKLVKKGKRKNTDPNQEKRQTSFTKRVAMPDKILKFITNGLKNDKFTPDVAEAIRAENYPSGAGISRARIMKICYSYAQKNGLYPVNEDGTLNKKTIRPDATLKKLFGLDDSSVINFNNFQKIIGKCVGDSEFLEVQEPEVKIPKSSVKKTKSQKEEVEDETEEANDDEEEEEEEPKPKKVGKKATKK